MRGKHTAMGHVIIIIISRNKLADALHTKHACVCSVCDRARTASVCGMSYSDGEKEAASASLLPEQLKQRAAVLHWLRAPGPHAPRRVPRTLLRRARRVGPCTGRKLRLVPGARLGRGDDTSSSSSSAGTGIYRAISRVHLAFDTATVATAAVFLASICTICDGKSGEAK